MRNKLLLNSKKIHLIGIAGAGMSALAGILKNNKIAVSGSDKNLTGHSEKNLPPDADFVVRSLAIDDDNIELKKAKRMRIPTLSYPEAVGMLTQKFRTIAVSGTHGKTTVTAMISKVLADNGFDPNVIVGASLQDFKNKNFRTGKSELLVLEACEYRRAFLNYSPSIAVIHTLELDHMDYYRDFEDYLRSFKQFAGNLPRDGYFFANLDNDRVKEIIKATQIKKFPAFNTFTYSSIHSECDYFLENGEVVHKDGKLGKLNLKIPGSHNRINALCCFSVCHTLGIASAKILRSLNAYAGASRRFEFKGKYKNCTVIDDYAHHPSEIKATLSGAREKYKSKKICVIFQPHQFSRTKFLFNEFSQAFADADFVIIPNIFESRDSESDKKSVSARDLANAIQTSDRAKGIYCDGFNGTVEYIGKNHKRFDVIITMGAGDVYKIADRLTN